MPGSSWFNRLRRRKKGKRSSADADADAVAAAVACTGTQISQRQPPAAPSQQPSACAGGYSPNRASYYFPTAERARPDNGLRCIARRDADADIALDVRVDVIHRRADRLNGTDAPPSTPDLKLRPIVTRTEHPDDAARSSSATTSAATTPSTRARGFHVKSPRRRRRRGHDGDGARKEEGARKRGWLYESLVVVKESSDPEREMAESMVEMVAANHIRSVEDLEEMLACYLALNAAEHHRAVVAAFRRVWIHLARQKSTARMVRPT